MNIKRGKGTFFRLSANEVHRFIIQLPIIAIDFFSFHCYFCCQLLSLCKRTFASHVLIVFSIFHTFGNQLGGISSLIN